MVTWKTWTPKTTSIKDGDINLTRTFGIGIVLHTITSLRKIHLFAGNCDAARFIPCRIHPIRRTGSNTSAAHSNGNMPTLHSKAHLYSTSGDYFYSARESIMRKDLGWGGYFTTEQIWVDALQLRLLCHFFATRAWTPCFGPLKIVG